MQSVTIQQFLSLSGGQIIGDLDTNQPISGCGIDSRAIQPGELFFALPGTRDHGIHFADMAYANGAVATVAERHVKHATQSPQIVVDDVEYALAQLANLHRNQSEALVIGITGSVGKTTTRQLVHSVLTATHTGHQSPRNFNNSLGVPLSLMSIGPTDEFAAIELATSQPGEIEYLASVARPEMAIITRIAPAHLDHLHSLDSIRDEKAALLKALPPEGTAFLNMDDPLLRPLVGQLKCGVVTFGEHPDADIRATEVTQQNGKLSMTVDGETFAVTVFGRHHVTNILAAVAVGVEIGLAPSDIRRGLDTFRPDAGRGNMTSSGALSVIDDTYNASPASVTALGHALGALDFDAGRSGRILVLGDMLGLGEQAEDLHFGVGASLAKTSITHILAVGEYASCLVEGFLEAGGHVGRISEFVELNTLLAILDIVAADGDTIAVKGSRATGMERVVKQLQQREHSFEKLRRAA